ncbi:DUF6285 domain-containing protein [Tardiphaga sp. 215_C5_N2_1]|uniref:DUF6285 domain-containing protein n=1 Tax=Tardiphaga sp. 215_C5_N2_1 TaxID=3240774 RepID=UPI003F8CB591
MQDKPEPVDILSAVAEFLRNEVGPIVKGRLAFRARVAVNAIELVRRQIELPQPLEQEEVRRLAELLRHETSLDEGNRELAQRIADGSIGPDTQGLLDHLRLTTLAKLAVDQPRYSGYLAALPAAVTPEGN